jgi:hypothetical protein
MEGVLVSAKRNGSNKIVTVVSGADGAYSFPRNRLEPGQYDISIRAVGYVLPGGAPKMAATSLPIQVPNSTSRCVNPIFSNWRCSSPTLSG